MDQLNEIVEALKAAFQPQFDALHTRLDALDIGTAPVDPDNPRTGGDPLAIAMVHEETGAVAYQGALAYQALKSQEFRDNPQVVEAINSVTPYVVHEGLSEELDLQAKANNGQREALLSVFLDKDDVFITVYDRFDFPEGGTPVAVKRYDGKNSSDRIGVFYTSPVQTDAALPTEVAVVTEYKSVVDRKIAWVLARQEEDRLRAARQE
ncbi:MAG: hypothetical protein AAF358_13660 [Pseudomonadota bacterium]